MRFFITPRSGFTLVEVLVAVAVLSILMSVSVFGLQGAKQKGRDAERVQDLEQIQLALRMYRDAYSTSTLPAYPSGDLIGDNTGIDTVIGAYLAGTVQDPLSTGTYAYYYDSAYTCAGTSRVVLIAQTMERSSAGNYTAVCGGIASNLGNGVTPTAASYILILK